MYILRKHISPKRESAQYVVKTMRTIATLYHYPIQPAGVEHGVMRR